MPTPLASPAATDVDRPSGFAVGVDVGGTNTKLGFVDPFGVVLAREEVPTKSLKDPQEACRFFKAFADEQFAKAGGGDGALSAGVAVPGVLDSNTGRLVYVANLPAWCDFPLLDELDRLFAGPVAVCNDANAAAVAEHSRMNLTDESLALITLGTGIGCGVVLRGEPFGGDHGCGFEIGHTPVDFSPEARVCGCGKPGHLEAYVSVRGVLKSVLQEIDLDGGESPTLKAARSGEPLAPRHVYEAAAEGDDACRRAIARVARRVGQAAALICQTLDPHAVLIGGAMTFGGNESPVGRQFLRDVQKVVRRYALDQVADEVFVGFAELGNDAGICGAAELARTGR